jgi:acetylornithine/N-succinyldiaminopimelate aminotransferase
VQTGLGRTGKLFAYQHYGIEPDIFTLAKALGSGFPIGAMLGKAKLAEAFTPGTHATTFGGTPIATATAIATVETIVGDKLPEHAAQMGDYLTGQLREVLKESKLVKEIRGKGLIIGIECTEPVADLISAIHEQGLLVVSAGPQVVRLLPNLLVTREEIDRAVGIIASVFASNQSAAAVH